MAAIVTIFGDSNAAGYRDTRHADSLDKTVQKLDFCKKAYNFARGGTTISPGEDNLTDWIHLTETRSTKNRRRIIRPADAAIVMIGTNDIFRDLATPAETLHAEMERLLRKTNTAPDRIHVVAPLCGADSRKAATARIRGEVQKVAKNFGAHYLELYPKEDEWQSHPDGGVDYGHCKKDFYLRICDHVGKWFETAGKSELAQESYIYEQKEKKGTASKTGVKTASKTTTAASQKSEKKTTS